MKKIATTVFLCFLCTFVPAFPVGATTLDEEMSRYSKECQDLTDAVNRLSGDSSEKEIDAVIQGLENLDDLEVPEEDFQGNGLTGSMMDPQADSEMSLQLYLAKIQLEMAKNTKNVAAEYMEKIQKSQAEMKLVSEIQQQVKLLQEKKATGLTDYIRSFMNERKLQYPQSSKYESGDWRYVEAVLEGYQERLSVEIQRNMVFLQDYMGQYNSYTQGANAAIQSSSSTLYGLSKGQTMFGQGNGGMMVTAVILGMIAGALLTLFAGKIKNGKIS